MMFNETSYLNDTGQAVGVGTSIGGKLVGGLVGGSWGGPIGAGIGLIGGLIAGIFARHRAKVQREDQISGAWAASGPQAIDAVMEAWRSGQASSSEAIQALGYIEQQFLEMTTPITKYKGKFGAFPDPEAPRPPHNCNWACGTSWDLHQQIKKLVAEIQGGSRSGSGSSGGGIFSGFGGASSDTTRDLLIVGGLALAVYAFK